MTSISSVPGYPAADLYRVSAPGVNQVDAVNRRPVPLQVAPTTSTAAGAATVAAANTAAAQTSSELATNPPPGYVGNLAALAPRAAASGPKLGANLDVSM
jgi:hypothetical protein